MFQRMKRSSSKSSLVLPVTRSLHTGEWNVFCVMSVTSLNRFVHVAMSPLHRHTLWVKFLSLIGDFPTDIFYNICQKNFSWLPLTGRRTVLSIHGLNLLLFCVSYNPYLLDSTMEQSVLEKLAGSQLAKKFPAFFGTRMFISAITSARHLSLSWASPIQSITPYHTSFISILISFSHLLLGLPCTRVSPPSYTMPSPFHSSRFYHTQNILRIQIIKLLIM